MKLIKLIELPLKHWNTAPAAKNEMHIRSPNPEELEKALAMCNVNGLDTIIVYKE